MCVMFVDEEEEVSMFVIYTECRKIYTYEYTGVET